MEHNILKLLNEVSYSCDGQHVVKLSFIDAQMQGILTKFVFYQKFKAYCAEAEFR